MPHPLLFLVIEAASVFLTIQITVGDLAQCICIQNKIKGDQQIAYFFFFLPLLQIQIQRLKPALNYTGNSNLNILIALNTMINISLSSCIYKYIYTIVKSLFIYVRFSRLHIYTQGQCAHSLPDWQGVLPSALRDKYIAQFLGMCISLTLCCSCQ